MAMIGKIEELIKQTYRMLSAFQKKWTLVIRNKVFTAA